jgi:hypothetical protein
MWPLSVVAASWRDNMNRTTFCGICEGTASIDVHERRTRQRCGLTMAAICLAEGTRREGIAGYG